MQTVNNSLEASLQQFYQVVAQFSVEQQLNIAEHIKKQALAQKWNQYAQSMPIKEADISEDEIMQEIKATRAENHAK